MIGTTLNNKLAEARRDLRRVKRQRAAIGRALTAETRRADALLTKYRTLRSRTLDLILRVEECSGYEPSWSLLQRTADELKRAL